MPPKRDPEEVLEALLDGVREAAGEGDPVFARDYRLGSSGVTVDLAIAAEEFIGFIVPPVDRAPADLAHRLATAARYFDRVVLAVDHDDVPAFADLPLSGAALWSIGSAGALHEHRAGCPNVVGPAALFDLMTPEHRAALLRPAVPPLAYDRRNPPITPAQVRTHFGLAPR